MASASPIPNGKKSNPPRRATEVSVAEFVRDKVLDVSRSNFPANSAESLASLSPLLERTFRYTYMLATRMRDEMLDDGKRKDLDHLVDEARKLQTSLLKGVSE